MRHAYENSRHHPLHSNEADNLADLVRDALDQPIHEVVVVDNGSTDNTAQVAHDAGARVIAEPRQGYGYACAAGVTDDADILLFLDGDYSSLPAEMMRLLRPIQHDEADLVLGSRVLGHMQPGAMLPHQRFGNWLVSRMMWLLYGLPVTDLGPYRAIRADLLRELAMQEIELSAGQRR